jgi:hypothetical protein
MKPSCHSIRVSVIFGNDRIRGGGGGEDAFGVIRNR